MVLQSPTPYSPLPSGRELDSSFNIPKRSNDDSGPNIAIISTNSVQVYNTDPIVAAGLGERRGS